MCNCLFVEYRCSCSKPECAHLKRKHANYHGEKALFQIDHFKWNYCTKYLASVGVPVPSDADSAIDPGLATPKDKNKKKSLKSYFTKPSKKSERNSRGSVNYKAIDENGDAVSFWSDASDAGSKETLTEVTDSNMAKQPSIHFPVKKSGDPRHGGEMPECESISYEGWCIERRVCRRCEDYWLERDSDV